MRKTLKRLLLVLLMLCIMAACAAFAEENQERLGGTGADPEGEHARVTDYSFSVSASSLQYGMHLYDSVLDASGSTVTLDALGKEAVFTAKVPVENLGEEAVLGVRPEFLPIQEGGAVEGRVYSTLPTGMETTVKVACGDTMLTSVVFGNVDYPVDTPITLAVNGNGLMLYDKLSGNAVGQGSIAF